MPSGIVWHFTTKDGHRFELDEGAHERGIESYVSVEPFWDSYCTKLGNVNKKYELKLELKWFKWFKSRGRQCEMRDNKLWVFRRWYRSRG
jgi:hypothetical protein